MPSRLAEVAALFLKLGTIGFGGPAVHVAAMEEETVERRRWLSRQHFLDLVGATNLIPGPNSTEMAMHVGFVHAGAAGLVVAGVCFIAPAVTITALVAWAYVEYGQVPQVRPLLAGINPAVLAIIFSAGWRLGRKAVKGTWLAVIALAVAAARLAGLDPIAALAAGSALGVIGLMLGRRGGRTAAGVSIGAAATLWSRATTAAPAGPLLAAATGAAAGAAISAWQLGLFFLKAGAVLYGSGYVLIAYLEDGLVHQLGVLSEQQLVEAVAVGQFTPGPILSTATFIGYVVMGGDGSVSAGLLGAAAATCGIFLPSFFFVAVLNPIIPRLRNWSLTAAFLDAVNAASIGLLAAVTAKLCWQTLGQAPVDWQSWLIAAAALTIVFRWKVAPAWIVLGGAAAGWLLFHYFDCLR